VRDTLVEIAGRPKCGSSSRPAHSRSSFRRARQTDGRAVVGRFRGADGRGCARRRRADRHALNEVAYALPPLPNLFFTRDVGIVIGEHAIIGSMRHGVRWTEELLIKALFRYDQKFENGGILYDGSEEKRINYTLEGGTCTPFAPISSCSASASGPAPRPSICCAISFSRTAA